MTVQVVAAVRFRPKPGKFGYGDETKDYPKKRPGLEGRKPDYLRGVYDVRGKRSGNKIELERQGVNTVENETIKNNILGVSRFMEKPDWRDASGRKGKGIGVYRFAGKYGANVDGYSPIYTPDLWSPSGDTFQLGTKGLLAWAGLLLVLLGVGINLILSTSALQQ